MKGLRGIGITGEQYVYECPECDSQFMEEREADMCYVADTWPEDARDFMRQDLVSLAGISWFDVKRKRPRNEPYSEHCLSNLRDRDGEEDQET